MRRALGADRDLRNIMLRQRVLVDVSNRRPRHHHCRRAGRAPVRACAIRLAGMQHGDGEFLACRAAQAAGIPFCLSTMSICSIEDVAEFRRQAVLVPALCDEGPRLRARADRARRRRQMQRAGAHRRPAGARPAPRRHPQRHDGSAGDPHRQSARHRHQAGLGAERAARQAQDLRQPRRPRQGHGGRHRAVALDRRPVRPGAELEGRRLDQEPVARPADHQGHLDVEDARMAAKTGAAALVVSNHGGRQLDGAPSSISPCPGSSTRSAPTSR